MTTFDSESEYLDEYDVDDDDDSVVYDADQPSVTRYNLILCELYNESLHGETTDSRVKSGYLVYCRFKQLDTEYIDDYTDDFNAYYLSLINDQHPATRHHSVFRNYKNIISRQNYIKPEIAECIYLENQECVAILKTFWIKIIQRTWKNVIKNRKDIVNRVCNLNYLKQRETTRNFTNSGLKILYPELRGMLSTLKEISNCVC
jgi:hypothetical protein